MPPMGPPIMSSICAIICAICGGIMPIMPIIMPSLLLICIIGFMPPIWSILSPINFLPSNSFSCLP
eukprot:6014223-Heterocapsa_arctica.AAC.1